MEKALKRLFDYQRFADNKRIADMIADNHSKNTTSFDKMAKYFFEIFF